MPSASTKAEFADELLELVGGQSEVPDPYPLYRRMRSEAPVYFSQELDSWFVTSYAGIQELTKDKRFSNSARNAAAFVPERAQDYAQELLSRMVLFVDPPQHTMLRKIITRTLSVKNSEARRPAIRAKVARLLDRLQDGQYDFLPTVAYPLPVSMTCELMGFPEDDAARLRDWSERYLTLLEFDVPPEVQVSGNAAFEEFRDYLAPFVASRQKSPTDDLTSDFVAAELAGELTRDDVMAYCLFLMVAAHVTTANLMTNGLHTLLTYRDQWELLGSRPELSASATEEILRYESPARNILPRWALQDIEMLGQTIRKGQKVVGILGAANRDPAQFDDPERFDVTRSPNRQVAFGAGPHLCSGAALARVEVSEMFAQLPQRFPGLAEVGDVTWASSWTKRGLGELVVRA